MIILIFHIIFLSYLFARLIYWNAYDRGWRNTIYEYRLHFRIRRIPHQLAKLKLKILGYWKSKSGVKFEPRGSVCKEWFLNMCKWYDSDIEKPPYFQGPCRETFDDWFKMRDE